MLAWGVFQGSLLRLRPMCNKAEQAGRWEMQVAGVMSGKLSADERPTCNAVRHGLVQLPLPKLRSLQFRQQGCPLCCCTCMHVMG